jgi:phosphatidylglycerol:prolipoprotein diacylglycerol transferase
MEAMADLGLFIWLWRKQKEGASSRLLVAIYLIGYGLIRFTLEYIRVNNWQAGGLAVAQWLGLTSVVIGLLLWRLSAHD